MAGRTSDLQEVEIPIKKVHRESKAAFFCEDAKGYVWLPKTHARFKRGRGRKIVVVPLWLAKEKGMI